MRRVQIILAIVAVALAGGGCYRRVISDSWEDFRRDTGATKREPRDGATRLDGRGRGGDPRATHLAVDGDASQTKDDSFDVRQHAQRWPYTLRVEVWNKSFKGNLRRIAQSRAEALRKQGYRAYYYHVGDVESMVTVGLFSDHDRMAQSLQLPDGRQIVQYFYGPRITELQQKFPHTLVNGNVYYLQLPNGQKQVETSKLVPIK